MEVLMTLKLKEILYSFVLVFITAQISQYLVHTGLFSFYDFLDKPNLTPQPSYFTYAWNLIYILLFLGFYIALVSEQSPSQYSDLNALFIMQLFLQILWCFSFFYLYQLWASVAVIILLDMVVALLLHSLFYINRWSFFLILPYFLWLLFATFLNIYILFLN